MKYFGIGLPRTGTKSLAAVFTMFGLRTQHVVMEGYDDYDAFCDTPVWADWRELYSRYPDSKWILTVRDPDAWVESFTKNILPHYVRWMTKGPSHLEGKTHNQDCRAYGKVFPSIHLDRQQLREVYTSHHNDVLSHFEQENRRSQLLVLDVANPSALNDVMVFLGKTSKDMRFPKLVGTWYGPLN